MKTQNDDDKITTLCACGCGAIVRVEWSDITGEKPGIFRSDEISPNCLRTADGQAETIPGNTP